eukprot:COSAG06_NODE_823_length_12076_cov_7.312432_10_plen_95_part_01
MNCTIGQGQTFSNELVVMLEVMLEVAAESCALARRRARSGVQASDLGCAAHSEPRHSLATVAHEKSAAALAGSRAYSVSAQHARGAPTPLQRRRG